MVTEPLLKALSDFSAQLLNWAGFITLNSWIIFHTGAIYLILKFRSSFYDWFLTVATCHVLWACYNLTNGWEIQNILCRVIIFRCVQSFNGTWAIYLLLCRLDRNIWGYVSIIWSELTPFKSPALKVSF